MGNRGFYGFSFHDAFPSFSESAREMPYIVPGLSVWYRAESIYQTNGDLITSWSDVSGNSRHLTAPSAKRPTFIANALNGYPAVRLFGGQYLQMPSGVSFGNDFTLFLLVRPATTLPIGMFETAPDQSNVIRNYSAGNFEWWNNNPMFALGLTNTNPIVLTFRISMPRSIVYYSNKTYVGTYAGEGLDGTVWTTPTFGSVSLGLYGYYSGDYHEILLYNRPLTDPETATIQDYLIGKYALIP
jgi:hypothetical protein